VARGHRPIGLGGDRTPISIVNCYYLGILLFEGVFYKLLEERRIYILVKTLFWIQAETILFPASFRELGDREVPKTLAATSL